jgi:hypothetical protein
MLKLTSLLQSQSYKKKMLKRQLTLCLQVLAVLNQITNNTLRVKMIKMSLSLHLMKNHLLTIK